jgi:hypothetical protein
MTWVPRTRSRTYIRVPTADELVAAGVKDDIDMTMEGGKRASPQSSKAS